MSTKPRRARAGSRAPKVSTTPSAIARETLTAADAARPLDLTLRLRPASRSLEAAVQQVTLGRRRALSREELGERFGANAADLRAVERWAARHKVEIVGRDPARRAIDLRAPARRLAKLFGVELVRCRRGEETWLGHRGAVRLPTALAESVRGVLGFDQRPLAARHAAPMASSAPGEHRLSFTAPEMARHYRFPEGVDGRGQTVGVIALGGGYRRKDLATFFRHLGVPHPRFTDVSVHGVKNAPAGPSRMADGEVTGDIETVGALAPGAHVVVYFGPNSERGFLETVSRAVHDPKHRPSVLSISWGTNEIVWPRRTLRLFDEVLAEAAAMGVTVCCASGDHGALADPRDRVPHVSYPGSSPHVVSCGGTSLRRRGGSRLEETAWHDAQGASGGGKSAIFSRPAWQTAPGLARVTGRGVPDVAANADPESGYRVFVLGHWVVGAGTSAAAPLWAGLVALINQRRADAGGEPLGLFTPQLYRRRSGLVEAGALRPIRRGEAGGASSHEDWNRHTGLGVPHGAKLAEALVSDERPARAGLPARGGRQAKRD